MPVTVAERIIAFNASLDFSGALPAGISIMNPFKDNHGALEASSAFYTRFYSDTVPRHMILGINPGRFGAGLTGVPFTDPKRLRDACHVDVYTGPMAHEPSSVFVYDMIAAYGGVERFYSEFYINSICPLGFTATNARGKEVNYNYYDKPELCEAVESFMMHSLRAQIAFGMKTDVCFCLGTGKNAKYIQQLNETHKFFDQVIPLEHPRYIIQYKSGQKQQYIDKYLQELRSVRR